MAPRLQPTKNTVSIQLTEPVIFLRGSTDSVVRGRNPENGAPQPAILRGLLTLTLLKPTKITSIEVELEGWTRTAWPEGIGARSIEVSEEHKILTASTVFFRAGHHPHMHIMEQQTQSTSSASTSGAALQQLPASSSIRRATSVGPGLALDWDDEQEVEPQFDQNVIPPSSSNSATQNDAPPPQYTLRRRASADYSTFNSTPVEHTQPSSSYPDDPPSFDDAIASPILMPVNGTLTPILSSPSIYSTPTRHNSHGHSSHIGHASGSGPLTAVQEGVISSSREDVNISIDNEEGTTEERSSARATGSLPYTQSTAAASTLSSESESSFSLSPRALSRHPSHETETSPLQMTPEDDRSLSSLAVSRDSERHSHSPSLMESSTDANGSLLDGDAALEGSAGNSSMSRGRHSLVGPLSSPSISRTPRSATMSSPNQNVALTTPDSSTFGHSDLNREQSFSSSARQQASLTPNNTPHANHDSAHRPHRHSSRFSLSAVSNALMEGIDAVKHRVRSRSRAEGHRQSRDPERRRSAVMNGEGANSRRQSGIFSGTHSFGTGGLSRDGSLERVFEIHHDRVPHNSIEENGEESSSIPTSSGMHKEHSALGWLGEAFGHDSHHHNQDGQGANKGSTHHGDGWKEFRKGTYTYPISFLIPNNTPPTLHCTLGSVSYTLKATVHRAGAFSTRLTARREITLVAAPGEDDLDESDNILVQRQWEDQMHYVIAVHGRAFPIGGKIPLSVTFMPMAKIKIYRISSLVEEHVDYFTNFKRLARSEAPKKFDLFSIKYTQASKDVPAHHLLPLNEPYISSPLYGLADATDVDEATSNLMGPGPWTLHVDLKIPHSEACKFHYNRSQASDENPDYFGREFGGGLHFTNKHRRSNMSVTHYLKVILRVERGDDQAVDPKTGKRRLFDIVIQMPIHLLSCQCNVQSTSLPLYSVVMANTRTAPSPLDALLPQLQVEAMSTGYNDNQLPTFSSSAPLLYDDANVQSTINQGGVEPSSAPEVLGDLRANVSTSASRSASRSVSRAPGISTALSTPPVPSRAPSRTPGTSVIRQDGVRRQSFAGSIADSVFERNSQFARLVAGQESESGEAPPHYEAQAIAGSNVSGDRPQLTLDLTGGNEVEERGRSRTRRVGTGIEEAA